MFDLLGKVVYTAQLKNKREHNIAFTANAAIAAGLYFLRISGDVNEQVKVIKTR